MRPEFLAPEDGITVQAACGMLALAGVILPDVTIAVWTEFERMLAYDWAVREHLVASDNNVKRRPKPVFVTAAEKRAEDLGERKDQDEQWHQASGRERTVQLNAQQAQELAVWTGWHNGALRLGRVSFESVPGGGILIRTKPYRAGDE